MEKVIVPYGESVEITLQRPDGRNIIHFIVNTTDKLRIEPSLGISSKEDREDTARLISNMNKED